MPNREGNIMCKDKAKDTLGILFANGQISFDSLRDAIRRLNDPHQIAYDHKHMKIDGREG
jgi:hypothetical protein